MSLNNTDKQKHRQLTIILLTTRKVYLHYHLHTNVAASCNIILKVSHVQSKLFRCNLLSMSKGFRLTALTRQKTVFVNECDHFYECCQAVECQFLFWGQRWLHSIKLQRIGRKCEKMKASMRICSLFYLFWWITLLSFFLHYFSFLINLLIRSV